MIPVSRIEIYQSGALLYTLDNLATYIRTRDILTSGVGNFAFSIPTKSGNDYKYYDINPHDQVKIYLGYDTVPSTPTFAGRIAKISAPLDTGQGYARVFEGKSNSEILERRLKQNKCWLDTEADDIAAEVATDLSLGSDLAVDTTHVNLTVKTESYFDLLQKLSDYWYSVIAQIKKDFYVDVGDAGHTIGHLVWKARPLRTSGVETLTIGENILDYQVLRDVLSVKNKIYVYGSAKTFYPADRDGWTEATTGWTAVFGTLSTDVADKKYGTCSVKCTPAAGSDTCTFYYTLPSTVTIRDINKLNFWRNYNNVAANTYNVGLLAPDVSNYWYASMGSGGAWTYCSIPMGPDQIYDANLNPNGAWTVGAGTPNWWNIQKVYFAVINTVANEPTRIDVLHFTPVRYYDNAENAASQTSYGLREMEHTDDTLLSNAMCESRAEALLYQMKDPAVNVKISVRGNTNILIGDRIPLTIPAENISAANYDVVQVEHEIIGGGWMTTATFLDSASTRQLSPFAIGELLKKQAKKVEQLEMDRKYIR